MVVVKSPDGDLERCSVLSAVRVRFGLIPFEDLRLFHVGMVRQCRMRVGGTLPTEDTAAGWRDWERRHDDDEGAQPNDVRSTCVTSWIRCVLAEYTREDRRPYGVAPVPVASGACTVSRTPPQMWPSCFTTLRRRSRLEMP